MFRLQSINHIGLKIKPSALYGALFWFLTAFISTLIFCLTFTIFHIERSQGMVTINRGEIMVNTVDTQPLKPLLKEAPAVNISNAVTATNSSPVGIYVASKAGKKYYLPTCSGAKSIKPANRIWFSSKTEAEASGYTPSATCKGL